MHTQKNTPMLPTLYLALFYVMQSLIGSQLVLDADFRTFTRTARGDWHFAVMLLLSLSLLVCARFMRRKDGEATLFLQKICSSCLALVVLGAGSGMLFFNLTQAGDGSPLLPYQFQSIMYGLFWPPLMLYFFSAVPQGRQGLCFGCAMGLGKLTWIVFLPTLGGMLPADMVWGHILHLRRLLGILSFLLGGALAWSIFCARARLFPHEEMMEPPGGGISRPFLLLVGIQLPIILYNATIGTGTGLSYMAPSLFPRVPDLSHALLLLAPLVTGVLLDGLFRGSRWGMHAVGLFLMAIVCAVPATMTLEPLRTGELSIIGPLVVAGRDCITLSMILIATWLAAMTWGKAPQQFTATIGYGFSVLALLVSGNIRSFLQGGGHSTVTAAAIIAMAFVTLSVSLMYWIGKLPWPIRSPRPAVSREVRESARDAGEEPDRKFLEFCLTFSLTPRESDIFLALLGGASMEDVCTRLRISERTFRFHVTGLLKKTAMLNRKRLLPFYTCWQPRGGRDE